MEDIRLGVIGGGAVAQIIHLPLLKKISGVKVIALVEQDRQRLQTLGKQHGIARLYHTPAELLSDPDVETVDICTSTDSHFEIATAALNAGKNVLVEKPPTANHEECEALAKLADEKGKLVLAAMNNRFRADFMMLKSYLNDKQLGDVFYISAAWHKYEPSTKMQPESATKSRRGVMLDLGVVLIDLSLWLLGFPEISGVNAAFFSHRYKGVEDSALVTMRTKQGGMIRLDASWGMQQPEESFRFEVYGTRGTATMNPLLLHRRIDEELVTLTPTQNSKFENVFKRSYETELTNFVRFLRGVKADMPTIGQMCKVMNIVDASYVSARRESALKL